MAKILPNQQPVTVETRQDGTMTISGYAAVFHRAEDPGTQFQLMDNYHERIKPGAFDRALAEKQDVRALFNHDPNHVLGRTTSGTLRLSTDSTGLRYDVDLPNTQTAKDLAESVNRGDVSGSSFAFSVNATGQEIERSEGQTYRNITDANLFDVSVVTYPAYESATSGMRSKENIAEAKEAVISWEKSHFAESDKVKIRLAQIKLDVNSNL
jgi:HK97 family phage prohead protease